MDPISAAVITAGATLVVGGATVCVAGIGAATAVGTLGYNIYKDRKERKILRKEKQMVCLALERG